MRSVYLISASVLTLLAGQSAAKIIVGIQRGQPCTLAPTGSIGFENELPGSAQSSKAPFIKIVPEQAGEQSFVNDSPAGVFDNIDDSVGNSCAAGLTCTKAWGFDLGPICSYTGKTIGESCNPSDGLNCSPGLACLSPPGNTDVSNFKCRYLPIAYSCPLDHSVRCEPEYFCFNGICSAPNMQLRSLGQTCGASAIDSLNKNCDSGLVCKSVSFQGKDVGITSCQKATVAPAQFNQACNAMKGVTCDYGLRCNSGSYSSPGICIRTRMIGETCLPNANPYQDGSCSDVSTTCAQFMFQGVDTKSWTCQPPMSYSKKGDSCNERLGSMCELGLLCNSLNPGYPGVCIKPIVPCTGDMCGLRQLGELCSLSAKPGKDGACANTKTMACTEFRFRNVTTGNYTCQIAKPSPVKVGGTCSYRQGLLCDTGLTCDVRNQVDSGTCRPNYALGSPCDTDKTWFSCPQDSVCATFSFKGLPKYKTCQKSGNVTLAGLKETCFERMGLMCKRQYQCNAQNDQSGGVCGLIPLGERCVLSLGVYAPSCATGLKCTRPVDDPLSTTGTCMEPLPKSKQKRHAHWVV